jgi:hypothetical protein
VETDCLELVKMLKSEGVDRSVHQTCITHVNRIENSSSHFMAIYVRTLASRTLASMAVWQCYGLDGLANICYQDCYL